MQERRAGSDRLSGIERREARELHYTGPERRRRPERRCGKDRRDLAG